LEYHSLRDEVWVRCSKGSMEPGEEGHMDVINANGLFTDSFSNFTVSDGEGNAYGYTVVDATLGDVGYVSERYQSHLMKLDLNKRTLIDKFPMDPLNSGIYEMAYSKVNRHIFARSMVCCTCGFVGADKGEDCGKYGGDNVTVLIGPNADPNKLQSGQCGHRCYGVDGIDILGVFEYDTQTDKKIATWLMKEGKTGTPFPSPSGEYIVLFGRNGGKTIRILKAGANGEKSSVYADVELGFNQTGVEDDQVYNDFAFIEKDGKNMIVLASSTENKISIVDMSGSSPTQSVVKFGNETDPSTSAYRNRRQVEWARGTDYVWVDGRDDEEVYVIDIVKKEVKTTIKGVSTTTIVNVNNWKAAAMQQASTASQASQASQESKASTYKDDNDVDAVGIIGLAVGAIALVMGAMNLFMFAQVKKFMSVRKGDTSTPLDDEEVTLGSKNVA